MMHHSLYRLCLWILLAGGMSISVPVSSQTESSYRMEGDEVVFVFDIRVYARELLGENALKVDFADFGIYDVAVSGEFNNWNRKGWRMHKKDEYVYELRKKLLAFSDAFPLDFRYIINGRYIADKEGNITDTKHFHDDFLEDIYHVDLSVLKIHDDGEVTFSLQGYQHKNEVILAGSFNNWNEHAIKMKKTADGWILRGDLPPGRYEYKFIADGEWLHDPKAKENVTNEHGTLNSVLWITIPVTFKLKGFADASKVILAGSFNDWNTNKERMSYVDGYWAVTLQLTGGKHSYKFIVDGNWMTDPENPLIENDFHGNKNSVMFVH